MRPPVLWIQLHSLLQMSFGVVELVQAKIRIPQIEFSAHRFDPQFLSDPSSVKAIEGIVLLINMYGILDPIGFNIRSQRRLPFGR